MTQFVKVPRKFGLSLKAAMSLRRRHWIGRSLVAFLLLMPALPFSHGAIQAADGEPTLSLPLPETKNVMNDNTFLLPITFTDAAEPNDISALSFSLDFDETCLTFDSVTDTDENGIPDAVTGLPGLPTDYVSTVSYDAADTDGEIDLTIHDPDSTQDALSDGVLVTFEFGVQSSCRTTNGTTKSTPFAFDTTPSPTFGNLLGVAVTGGTHRNGTYTLRFNTYPTDISLTATSVAENVALGTAVGTLSSTDLDADLSQTHTYSLVSGTGDTNNSSFVIDGSTLKTNAVLNYESESSYLIRLRTTDNLGGTHEEAFTITVTDLNEAPTGLSIGTSSVAENATSNTLVGSFTSVDPDAGATATYSLVSGVGDTNNGSFNIDGTNLQTSAIFNYEVKNAYNIRVRVTDNGTPGLTFENIFTIRVNNVNDAPVAVEDVLDPAVQVISGATDIFVLNNDTDEDIGATLTVEAVGTPVPNSGTVTDNDTYIQYVPALDFNGPVDFSYTASDGIALSNSANVSIQVVANKARGDCNADDNVNAGDFPALVLEINDTDATSDWYNSYTGGFAGSPMGCDANVSKSVTVADLTCAVLVSFGNTTCTTSLPVLAAGTMAAAELAVGQDLVGVRSNTVAVPVFLKTNGQNVAAASFALDFDESQLVFDPADADGNGVPDAITFQTPPGMVTVANYNAISGYLEVTVYAVTMPMPTFTDGLVANVTFKIDAQATQIETPIALVQSSLGSDQGQAVPVQVKDGLLRIAQLNGFLFLPLLNH